MLHLVLHPHTNISTMIVRIIPRILERFRRHHLPHICDGAEHVEFCTDSIRSRLMNGIDLCALFVDRVVAVGRCKAGSAVSTAGVPSERSVGVSRVRHGESGLLRPARPHQKCLPNVRTVSVLWGYLYVVYWAESSTRFI